MRILITFSLSLLFILAGCSPDQKVVRQLDGEWKVTGVTYNGTPEDPQDYAGLSWKFDKCKVKKEDCDGSVGFLGLAIPFKYSVYEDGTKLKVTTNFAGVQVTETGDILEHSKTSLRLKLVDDNGDVTETSFEKL